MPPIPDLPALVRKQFTAAQKSGDLTFFQTQVSIVQIAGLPFQVRFSPALANKPKSNKPRDPSEKPFDPFESPPAALFVTDLPAHNLVLNKFPVIPNHFILATKVFKEQTDPLEEEDLEAAYRCLQAYRDHGEELFGFYNSGEHSGASQRRRHIQFLPVESMRSGIAEGDEWRVLADSLVEKPSLPFTYYASRISDNPTSGELYATYKELHHKAVHESSSEATSPTSYNLGMTDHAMVICPRTSEGTLIKDQNGDAIGPVSLNGTVLGGTLLVKSEAEWNVLKSDESQLETVLRAIGIEPMRSSPDGKL